MTRYIWLCAAATAAVHVFSLGDRQVEATIGLLIPCTIVGLALSGWTIVRAVLSGHGTVSIIRTLPKTGLTVIAGVLIYTGFRLIQLVFAVLETGIAPIPLFLQTLSAILVYVLVAAAYMAELTPVALQPPEKAPPLGPLLPRPRVPMGLRYGLIVFGGFGGFFAFAVLMAPEVESPLIAILTVLTFVVVVNGSAFLFLRCPRCGKFATQSASGWSTPWVGSECRNCGQPY